jgi:hypothetical protein
MDPDEFRGFPGWYADLFVDLMSRGGSSLDAGASWNEEPSDLVGQDVGISGFLRFQQWVRPARGRAPGASGAADSTDPKKGES